VTAVAEPPSDEPDDELYRLLHRAKFEGPAWDRVSVHLARYGTQVCRPLIATGRILTLCGNAGRRLKPPPRPLSHDDVELLTVETVGEGLLSFQEALRRGRWTPDGSAKMTTALVGYCVGEFPNIWRRWVRTSASAVEAVGMLELEERPDLCRLSDPGSWIDLRETLEAEVPDEVLRKILVLESMGYKHGEIADYIGGLTGPAVTERLRKHRRRRQQGKGV